MDRTLRILSPAALGASLLAVVVAARGEARPAGDDEAGPVAVVAHVDVMPNFTAAGRDLLRKFAAESKGDPGLVRFEVFEEVGRPNHSTVVSLWRDRASFDGHLALDHTRKTRGDLQPMLGSPFDERIHRPGR